MSNKNHFFSFVRRLLSIFQFIYFSRLFVAPEEKPGKRKASMKREGSDDDDLIVKETLERLKKPSDGVIT